MRLAIALLIWVALVGCASKSTDFGGVHVSGQRQMIGVVSTTAAAPVAAFVNEWVSAWERKDFATCYRAFAPELQMKTSVTQLAELSAALETRYGKSRSLRAAGLPVLAALPAIDEALFKSGPSEALKYYDYMLGRYLNEREKQNVYFFFGVAEREAQLRLVTLGVRKARNSPEEPNETPFWVGYPAF